MSKQTAVQWLWLNLTDDMIGALSPKQIKSIYYLVQKAKAMEKEQIVEAYDNGYDLRDDMGSLSSNPKGEQYYNETYKGGQDGI